MGLATKPGLRMLRCPHAGTGMQASLCPFSQMGFQRPPLCVGCQTSAKPSQGNADISLQVHSQVKICLGNPFLRYSEFPLPGVERKEGLSDGEVQTPACLDTDEKKTAKGLLNVELGGCVLTRSALGTSAA